MFLKEIPDFLSTVDRVQGYFSITNNKLTSLKNSPRIITDSFYCSNNNIKNFKYRISWDKLQGGGFLNSKKRPLTRIEDICVFSYVPLGKSTYNPIMTAKPAKNIRPHGSRKPCDVTTYGKHSSKLSDSYDNSLSHPTDLIAISSKQKECNSINRVHPTQKPVEILEYFIALLSNRGDTVLDTFAGSGSTGVACYNTGRDCWLIEQDPVMFAKMQNRIDSLSTLLEFS